MDGALIMISLRKSGSRSEAETTLERSDDGSKSEVLQKPNKKVGGVLYNYKILHSGKQGQ